MNGYCCLACKFVFPLSDALTEFVSLRDGGPSTRYSCPSCMSFNLNEVCVCPECLREELVKGEDLGKNCLVAEQDALDELQLDKFDHRNYSSLGYRRAS